ncbi:MAG: NAD(P)-dependent oxidoreductase [Planctomycetes bacterium]|nr:NAD(P)-dependent oxidoreductase [Planctomycetota bacterium]
MSSRAKRREGGHARVLVTGAEGFLGRRLVPRLAQLWDVVAVGHGSPGLELGCGHGVRGLPPVDAVVHLAAAVGWGPRGGDALRMRRVNARGTGRLMRWAAGAGVRRVVYASSYVYGPPRYLPVDEAHPLAPANPYAASKLRGEEWVRRSARAGGLDAVILRLFNVYGPGQGGDLLVPTILRQLPSGVVVLRDPRPRRDLLHVEDAVEAFLAALLGPPGVHTINIGSGRSHSVAEVVDRVEAAAGVRLARVFTGPDDDPVRETRADVRRALEVLGWRPRVDLAEGIGRCVAAIARQAVTA